MKYIVLICSLYISIKMYQLTLDYCIDGNLPHGKLVHSNAIGFVGLFFERTRNRKSHGKKCHLHLPELCKNVY